MIINTNIWDWIGGCIAMIIVFWGGWVILRNMLRDDDVIEFKDSDMNNEYLTPDDFTTATATDFCEGCFYQFEKPAVCACNPIVLCLNSKHGDCIDNGHIYILKEE